jgi:membrane protein implicated in regulation of membrane protease activity
MDAFWAALRDNMWGTWLGLAMLLGVAELFSLNLVLLMLSVGALVGMLVALLGLGIPLQIVFAAGASIAMLSFIRPEMLEKLNRGGPNLRTGTHALIGKEGFAIDEINAHGGQVKLGGEVWSARPYIDDEVIPAGAKVELFEIRGATAYVHEVPQLGSTGTL